MLSWGRFRGKSLCRKAGAPCAVAGSPGLSGLAPSLAGRYSEGEEPQEDHPAEGMAC